MFRKRVQLGLIHVAVAMTLVPINSTLNRIMIKELAMSATLVALLASLPYLFSPVQMAIGSFSDRHPVIGYRRTPYIALGLLLCVLGVIVAPQAAYLMSTHWWKGLMLGIVSFGAWGMGYNFASVSYLSLASELSGAKGRSRTISVMFFMMIVGIILTALGLSRLLETYSPSVLERAFLIVAVTAFVLGVLGLIGLEPRSKEKPEGAKERIRKRSQIRFIIENKQVTLFFVYMVLMLTAILGQDILLEPFAAEAFDMSVQQTTRITAIWGVCFLLSLVAAGVSEGRISKRTVAIVGAWGAISSFLLIAGSALAANQGIFYLGVVLLGLSTGLATVSNLSLMLDMTIAGKVGMFIGIWGVANALARLTGNVMSGAVRDIVTFLTQNPVSGYMVVFVIEALLLGVSLVLLRGIDVHAFRKQVEDQPNLIERAAMANDA
ncbi:MAG: BCD family MFS transporter [Chloroflexota bacterium]|nr:BCD family MFS transporter [Chloroflexota bacterium]